LCFNLKEVEKTKKGAIFYVPGSTIKANQTSIAFVDNTNHYSNGENYQLNMKTIIEKYQALYKATGSQISVEKSYLYC